MTSNFEQYERPAVAVDLVLFRLFNHSLQVALIKRPPDTVEANKWCLPGSFVDIDQTLSETIYNKIAKKIGCQNFTVEPLTIKDNPERDERWRVISCVYLGILSPLMEPHNYQCEWFTIHGKMLEGPVNIRMDELAFDHASMLQEAIQTIKDNLYDTDKVFAMMDETFTMSDLKTTFENITGDEIGNFARRMKPFVEPTGEQVLGRACRPAAKFRYKNRPSEPSKTTQTK